jgi:tetratricopeptide (TPR) repeat protein
MRVSVQLIDARSQHTIWSELYDRSGADVLGLQQEIATEIAARLEPEIESAERRLGQFAPPVKPVVWHLVRRGLWHHYRFTREDAPLARRYFERALMRDPHSVEALVALGWWTFQDCAVRRCAPQEWDALRGYAERALAIDPRDARATTQLGVVHMMQSRHAQARTLFREAININPSYAWAYSHLGSSFYLDGMPEQALIPQRTSIRLSPFDVFVFHAFGELAMALFMLEDWPAAIDATEHSLRLRHGYWLAHVVRVASLAYAQRSADAAFALEELRTNRPEFSQRDVEWLMFTDRKWNARLLDGLRIAGWNPQ